MKWIKASENNNPGITKWYIVRTDYHTGRCYCDNKNALKRYCHLNNINLNEVEWLDESNEPSIDIRSISEKWVGIWQRGENPNLFQCVDEAIKEALKPSIQDGRLQEVYEEYIKLLGEDFNELLSYGYIHGWKSTRYEKAINLRAKIESLKNKPQPLQEDGLEGILLDFTLYLSKRNFTRDYDFEFEKEIKKFLKTNKS